MFVIRDDKGEILHKSEKPIADPRAVEVAADQVEAVRAEPIKAGIVWVKRYARCCFAAHERTRGFSVLSARSISICSVSRS